MKREGHYQFAVLGVAVFVATSFCHLAAAADLQQIRLKPMWDRTEVVLDLVGQPQGMVLNKTKPGEVNLQFDGKIDLTMKPKQLPIAPNQGIKAISWNEKDGKIQVTINRRDNAQVNMYPLENPDRIVISVDNLVNTKSTRTVGPGVLHHTLVKSSSRGPLNVNILEIDPSNPEIVIEPVLAAGQNLHGKARVSQMVNRRGAIGGINASFFKPDSGTVLGTVIMNHELLAGPIYNRVCLGLTEDKHFKMGRIALRGHISNQNGLQVPLTNVNQPRLSKQEYILYSPKWGSLAPDTSKEGIQVQIRDNKVAAITTVRQLIPSDGYVLIGPADGPIKDLVVGDNIALEAFTTPDWSDVSHALSGGPYLVRNGQLFVDTQDQSFRPGGFTGPAPRTAVGYTAGNHLLMVTVDGRQNKSVGVTLYEMAKLMKELGAVDAMNFDGGSSTQMVVRGRVVNSPSVAGGANVSSALIVRQVPLPVDSELIGGASDGLTDDTQQF